MKKLAILMSLLMVVAFATPALANPISFSGNLKNVVTYSKPNLSDPGSWSGSSTLTLNSAFSAPSATIQVVGIGSVTQTFGTDWPPTDLLKASMSQAWMTIEGPYREGGQQLTTRIGDFDLDGDGACENTGVQITGITLGDNITGSAYWDARINKMRGDFTIPGDTISGTFGVQSQNGDIAYNGTASMSPNDQVSLGAVFASDGTYKFSSTVKATDDITVNGWINQAQAYDVNVTMPLPVTFDPTVKVGYKSDGTNAGYYTQANAVVGSLNTQFYYEDVTSAWHRTVVGTGGIYARAAAGLAPDPFDPALAGQKGYAGIYNSSTCVLQFASRFDLSELVALGTASGTTVTAKSDLYTNMDSGSVTQNKIGVEVGTAVSFAGFNNVNLTMDVTSKLVANENVITMGANYTAPNGIAFSALRANDGSLSLTASKTISF